MSNFARIINNVAVDVSGDPENSFHPEIAAQFVSVPDNVAPGWVKGADGEWAAPITAASPGIPPALLPLLDPLDFYLAFTVAERRAVKASTNEDVIEFWNTYERCERDKKPIDPNRPSVVAVLEGLVALGILASANRIPQIQAGIPQ